MFKKEFTQYPHHTDPYAKHRITDEELDFLYELQKEMNKFVASQNLDLFVVAFTSILENGSSFYACGPLQDIVTEAFPDRDGKHSFQEDILSRKNQIVPLLSRAIINSSI